MSGGNFTEKSVTVTYTNVNDAPVATASSASISEDIALASNTGVSVASIASSFIDADASANKGIAITDVNVQHGL